MKKIFCFDLDNVICKTYENFYSKSLPIKKNIDVINLLYEQGHIIKIFTARYMGRSNENVKIAEKKALKITLKQLKNWQVKYNKLIFGKPSFDVYIDDKNINFKDNWANLIKKKYL